MGDTRASRLGTCCAGILLDVVGGSPPSTRRAPAHACVGFALGLGLSLGAGCEGRSVEARAVWVDGAGGEDARRIHVYDRGELELLEVEGQVAPQEFLRLGPRGRGVLLRVGSQTAAWFDLVDGRRLPLGLPALTLAGGEVEFSADGRALWWTRDEGLSLVPLARGAARLEQDTRVAQTFHLEGSYFWAQSAPAAPLLLARDTQGRGEWVRFPVREGDEAALRSVGRSPALPLPVLATREQDCGAISACGASVSLAPNGARAIVRGLDGMYYEIDGARPESSGLLDEPPELADASSRALLQVLDGDVSVWSRPGQLLRWDQRTAQVEASPVFFTPPLRYMSAERGSALVLLSAMGPMMRVDARGSELISLETTDCGLLGEFEPALSPTGEFAAWSCADPSDPSEVSGVIVRVSRGGLERFVGVPMRVVAIDDAGGVLLYSVTAEQQDAVDGIGPFTRPRNLFVLTRGGVLTRVDELEPAPAPSLVGTSEPSTYIQGRSLDE